jgi:hypothetical protein
LTTERITDLVISLIEDARITQLEDAFGTILSTLVRTFKGLISVRVMAQGLNALAEHLLKNTSDENRQNGEKYPQGSEEMRLEMKNCNSQDHRSGARAQPSHNGESQFRSPEDHEVLVEFNRIVMDVQGLELSQVHETLPGSFGTSTRTITIAGTPNAGSVEIVMMANEPDKLRFPGELSGGAVPPSREAFE